MRRAVALLALVGRAFDGVWWGIRSATTREPAAVVALLVYAGWLGFMIGRAT